jgi:hypothetical protein
MVNLHITLNTGEEINQSINVLYILDDKYCIQSSPIRALHEYQVKSMPKGHYHIPMSDVFKLYVK